MITSRLFVGRDEVVGSAGEIARAIAASTAMKINHSKTVGNIRRSASPSRGYLLCYHDGKPLGFVEIDIKRNELHSSVGYFPVAPDRQSLVREAENEAFLRLIDFAHRRNFRTKIPITDYWRPTAGFKEKVGETHKNSRLRTRGIGIRTFLVSPPGWQPEVTRMGRLSKVARDLHSDLSAPIRSAWSRRPRVLRKHPKLIRRLRPVH